MTIMMIVAALAVAQGAETPLTHRTEVPVKGRSVAIDYAGQVVLATDQRGMAPPGGRTSTERCHWSATLDVERSVGGQALRRIASDWTQHGSVPGNCRTVVTMIEREVDARLGAAQQALVASAEADRETLLAELEALDQSAAND